MVSNHYMMSTQQMVTSDNSNQEDEAAASPMPRSHGASRPNSSRSTRKPYSRRLYSEDQVSFSLKDSASGNHDFAEMPIFGSSGEPILCTEQPHDSREQHLAIQLDVEQPSAITTTKNVDFTNDPHPSLETPLLYFILKRYPRLLSAIQVFYDFRWNITYPLQNRIPCSHFLRKFKIILTWSEVFLLLPFFIFLMLGFVYPFLDPSVSMSGHACRTPLILAFVTATRNNILTFFLGMPVERAIKYHKLAGRVAYLNSLVHTYIAFKYPMMETSSSSNTLNFLFQDTVNTGGSMLMLSMTTMIITALPYFRKKFFDFFYLVHVTFVIFMMGFAFCHTGFLVPLLASLTWGLDILVRKIYMPFFRYPRKAKLEIISDTVVELSFSKADGFDFNPGQYIYICVPQLGYFQWHPFSLSSSPKQKCVTLHIRKGGDWTSALYALTEKQKEVDILIEGPYGSVGVDLTNPDKYQTVMLFSGGIGVTPMQSLCNSLMYEHNHGMRKLEKLSFIWIERDPVIMPEVDVVRRESIRCSEFSKDDLGAHLESARTTTKSIGKHDDHICQSRAPRRACSLSSISVVSDDDGTTQLAAQLLSLVPPSRDTDQQLEEEYSYSGDHFDLWDVDEDGDEDDQSEAPDRLEAGLQESSSKRRARKSISFNVDEPHAPWKAGDEYSIDESFLDQAFQNDNSASGPLDLQVYLTNTQVSQATKRCMPPFVTLGRPDIKRLFHEARHDALRNHQARVAVCVCAPLRIVSLCRKACAKYSDKNVVFDFHYEVFE